MAMIGSLGVDMKVQTNAFSAGLAKSATMVKNFAGGVASAAKQIALLGAAGVGAAGLGLFKMVDTAANLNESMNKVGVVFGDNSKIVVDSAQNMADTFGTSKNKFLDATGKLGGLFKGAGFANKEIAQLSVQITKLATDATSLRNVDFDTALTKLRSGLSGEAEPLRDFGVFLDEATTKAAAFKMGIAKVGDELTTQQKIQARLSIIMEAMRDDQGDLSKTAGEWKNATREVGGRLENLSNVISNSLMPVMTSFVNDINTGIQALSQYWSDNQNQVVAWAKDAVGGVGDTSNSIGLLQRAIGKVANSWNAMRLAFYAVQSYITSGLGIIAKNLLRVSTLLDKLSGSKSSKEYLTAVSEDLKKLSDKQWEAFQQKLKEPWPSDAIDEYFKNAREKTKSLRDEFAKMPKIGGVKVGDLQAKKAKEKGKHEEASAAAVGSVEAVNAVLRSKYSGGGAPDTKKETAKISTNTEKTAAILGTIAAMIAKNKTGNALLELF